MMWRNWVILAVPAAAMTRAPAMAASSSATASDRCRCAPRKLMLTACAFWMMKISTTMRATMPTISAVRTPLILVLIPRRPGAAWAGPRGGAEPLGAEPLGAEPLSEAGGRVMVAAGGATGSVMALLPMRTGTWAQMSGLPVADTDAWPDRPGVFECLK